MQYRLYYSAGDGTTVDTGVDGSFVLDLDADGRIVTEDRAADRGLRFDVTPTGLAVTEEGEPGHTTVNGVPTPGPVAVAPGDVVRNGAATVVIDAAVDGRPPMAAAITPFVVVRFHPDGPGAHVVADVARRAQLAVERLGDLGRGLRTRIPTVHLIDPTADPHHPDEILVDGSVVDPASCSVWTVVAGGAPPDPLERPLALCAGAALGAPPTSGPLLEAFGLWAAGSEDPTEALRTVADLPARDEASGELGAALQLSFVSYMVGRLGRQAVEHLLLAPTTEGGSQEEITDLEAAWRSHLAGSSGPGGGRSLLHLASTYLRPHWYRELELFCYTLVGLAFIAAFPFAFRTLIDSAIPSRQFSHVLAVIGVLLAIFAVSMAAQLRSTYLAAVVSTDVVRQIRSQMYDRLQHLPFGWFGEHEQGDVLSRIFSDVELVEQGLTQALRGGVAQVLSLTVSAVVMLTLDPVLGLITLASLPVVAVVYRLMTRGAQERSLAVQSETGGLLAIISEGYVGRAVIRAFGLEDRELHRMHEASSSLVRRQVRLALFGGYFQFSVSSIIILSRLVILLIGSWLVFHGHLTVGGLVAFVTVSAEAMGPVTELTTIGQQFQASTGAVSRIDEILEAPLEQPEVDLPPLEGVRQGIELRDVSFSYGAGHTTIDGVSFRVAVGERVAIVGPTGSGKSSILQLLLRFYQPDLGSILVDGVDLGTVDVSSWRRRIGLVAQDSFLFNASIAENIRMGRPDATDAEVEAVIAAVDLGAFVSELPDGVSTEVGEHGSRLSGGQRQRLALARALLRDPDLLILDEATSALDARTERLISATLADAGRGRTVISVSHRLASIADYDRIVVLEDGRLVEQGRHDELLALGGLYATLWSEQSVIGASPAIRDDARAALASVPIFASLDDDVIEDLLPLMRSDELPAGTAQDDDGSVILFIRDGSATIQEPDFSGAPVAVGELSAGSCFGISGLLGAASPAVLVATEALPVLVLDGDAVHALGATHPSLAAALAGRSEPVVIPRSAQRLGRVTLGHSRPVQPLTPPGAADADPTPPLRSPSS